MISSEIDKDKPGGTTGAEICCSRPLYNMEGRGFFCCLNSYEGDCMVTVSIVNVTSYTGLELLRLLAQHPQFVVTSVTARSAVGKRLDEVFPQLHAESAKTSLNPALVIADEPERTELAFVCLPHAAAAESVQRLLQQGTKVVDLSADFRLHNVHMYEEWYKHTHPAPALLETAVD